MAVSVRKVDVPGPGPAFATGRRRADAVHLLGPGAVGRALLARLASSRRRLVAVTDTTATLFEPAGLDPVRIAEWKAAGRPVAAIPGALRIPAAEAVARVDADIVVDAASTDPGRRGWAEALAGTLERGAGVALAAKGVLSEHGAEWLSGEAVERIGCNAVLGGTGRHFADDLPELRRRWRAVAIVGNASTTTIIEAMERGASLADGLAEAARRGYLEPDPELDLRGADAAVKLAIVAGALTGRRVPLADIQCDDLRDVDPAVIRARRARGATTRLVARLSPDGSLRVACEEVALDSVLAARCGQVVYDYHLDRGERRIHIGGGLGPEATADALWIDVQAIAGVHARAALRTAGGRP